MFDLECIGWSPLLERAFSGFAAGGLRPARVSAVYTHLYRLWGGEGELMAELAGRLRHAADGPHALPAVGDWVAAAPRPTEGRATIHAVLPRHSRVSRKVAGRTTDEQIVAANVDTLFLLAGLDRDFNPRRIERALVVARESGARPVIVLTKPDLCIEVEARRRTVQELAGGAPVCVVSPLLDQGLEQLAVHLAPGRTVALVGSSGVGKSTLINRLLGEDRQPTAAVRPADGRGCHTTTQRELVRLPGGGLIIDTPGLREIQLWSDAAVLAETFDDVQTLAASCRFKDCAHESEPGCAVRAALAAGALPQERLDSYRKLGRELRHLELRLDGRARLEAKARTKAIHRAQRQRRLRP